MAGNVILCPCGYTMEAAKVVSATSEATGYPKENLLGFNLNKYWKPTSTANQTIIIDLGVAKQVDGVGIWIHNYLSDQDNGGTAALVVDACDSSGFASSVVTIDAGRTIPNPSQQFLYVSGQTSQTKRYVRLRFSNMATVIEISQIFIYRTCNLNMSAQWESDDSPKYDTFVSDTNGGYRFAARRGKLGPKEFSRKFALNATQFAALMLAFNQSYGRAYPLIMLEGTTETDNIVVMFDQDKIPESQTDYQLYRPTVKFLQVPYIQDGEVF